MILLFKFSIENAAPIVCAQADSSPPYCTCRPYFPFPVEGNRALEVGEGFQTDASESSGPCPQLPSIMPGIGWHTLGTTGLQRLQVLQCPGLLLAIRGRIFGHSRSLSTKQNLPECKHSNNAAQELFPSPQMPAGPLPHGHSQNNLKARFD